jgi:hypothetical protein
MRVEYQIIFTFTFVFFCFQNFTENIFGIKGKNKLFILENKNPNAVNERAEHPHEQVLQTKCVTFSKARK